jgi:dTDP-4-dehydrorhamnose 3,5-epimerase
MIDGVYLTQLKDIGTNGGSVLHAMKKSDDGFRGFGEAYFSVVDYGIVRGWKRHREMTLNLVVPVGEIKFVLIDDGQSSENINLCEFILSRRYYNRLTVPPGVWVGFQGLSTSENMLLNLSNVLHDPTESDHKNISQFSYDWNLQSSVKTSLT